MSVSKMKMKRTRTVSVVAMVGQTVDISNLWNSRGIGEVLIRLLTR